MSDTRATATATAASTTNPLVVTAAWLVVGTPLAYGLWQTILKAAKLFGG
ncbi:MFS transporter small subunit [Pedococcus soli]